MTGTGSDPIGENKEPFKHRTTCRICKSEKLHKFISLGPTPLANAFLKREQLDLPEPTFPLDVYFCLNCHLVQLLDVVPPEILFKDYAYLSGASKPIETHFSTIADVASIKYRLKEDGLVVDIGSNDGSLLLCFSKRGFRTLGIEPASNIAEIAEKRGIKTENDFFSYKCAIRVSKEHGKADIITATNVFAHVDDLEDFVMGIDALLAEAGTFIIEVPYLINLLKNTEFDTIYHEHLSYFSVHPLIFLFKKFKMEIVDIESIDVHGGSIRVFVKRQPNTQSKAVLELLSREKNEKLDSIKPYTDFADRVNVLKKNLVALLESLKEKGVSITGYGATAKGNTLLNYCGIDSDILDYISDTTMFKQGKFTPGMHIPIYSEDRFHESPPDYALLLAWNYAEDILKKEGKFRQSGGKFILPIPEVTVV